MPPLPACIPCLPHSPPLSLCPLSPCRSRSHGQPPRSSNPSPLSDSREEKSLRELTAKGCVAKRMHRLRLGRWFPPGKVLPAPQLLLAAPCLHWNQQDQSSDSDPCLKRGLCVVAQGELCRHSWSEASARGQWDRASLPLAEAQPRSEEPPFPRQECRRVQPEAD